MDAEQDYVSILEDLEGSKRVMWADENTRESLDVASIINFTSCTPVRTPARTRNILTSNTPQRVDLEQNEENIEVDYELITAKNSYFNSRKDLAGEAEFSVKNSGKCDYEGLDSGHSHKNASSESKESCKAISTVLGESPVVEPHGSLKRHLIGEPSLLSPSSRRMMKFDNDFQCSVKVARFDPNLLPHVPTAEPSIQSEQIRENTEIHAKDRRDTIVLQKGPEEVRDLPFISSVATSKEAFNEKDRASRSFVQAVSDRSDSSDDAARAGDLETQDVIETKRVVPPTLNATLDLTSSNVVYHEAVPTDHDLSGVDPIPDTPDRKPLSLLCENKINGDSVSSTEATLKQHGLPSMRSGSNLRIGKPSAQPASKIKANTLKQDNLKMLNSSSKTVAAKSKYSSITSRLYEENPRYTPNSSIFKARQKSDRRRRSNTLTNPIRLRDSRRRSRSSTASTPYSLQASRKTIPSHLLGVRRAVEQMGSLKGHRRVFTPVTSSAVMKAMQSSAL